jgi:hypothetical protein
MKTLLLLAATLLISSAHAGALYKCVAADGKISYASHPCSNQAATTLPAAPVADAGLAAARLQQLRSAETAFQRRHAVRNAEQASDAARASAQQQRAHAAAERKQQQQQRQQAKDKAASRVGNCERTRPEAGCL